MNVEPTNNCMRDIFDDFANVCMFVHVFVRLCMCKWQPSSSRVSSVTCSVDSVVLMCPRELFFKVKGGCAGEILNFFEQACKPLVSVSHIQTHKNTRVQARRNVKLLNPDKARAQRTNPRKKQTKHRIDDGAPKEGEPERETSPNDAVLTLSGLASAPNDSATNKSDLVVSSADPALARTPSRAQTIVPDSSEPVDSSSDTALASALFSRSVAMQVCVCVCVLCCISSGTA